MDGRPEGARHYNSYLVKRLLLLLLLTIPAAAQDRLGSIAFPNSGKPEAQAAFVRGVAALHNFWYDEAEEAFRQAEAIDPGFALAYWGEAMTHNHPIWMEVDVSAGLTALGKGKTAKAPTAREQAYLDAVAILYGDGEKAQRDRAYEEAMGKLAAAYPDDAEAQAFHALAILGTMQRDEPDARKQIRAAAILEPLFATHPDHPGVLHYLIHAYDDPLHAPLGLRAARLYAKVAPAAFHALHMPSHIFLQLGMWPETSASNEQSYAASKAIVERKKQPSSRRDLHSLSWLQYSYLQQGRLADAKKLLDEVKPFAGESDRERTTRERMQARYAIETGDWSVLPEEPKAAVAAAKSEGHVGCAAPYSQSGEALRFAYGLRAIARGDVAGAAAAASKLGERRASQSGTDARTTEVMQRELEALVRSAEGKSSEALEILAGAVKVEETLGAPSGPPDVLKPAHELYGELLLKAGRREEAREQFRQSLLRMPNRTASVEGARACQKTPM